MLLNKPSSPENHAHFNSLLNRPILVDAKMMGHTNTVDDALPIRPGMGAVFRCEPAAGRRFPPGLDSAGDTRVAAVVLTPASHDNDANAAGEAACEKPPRRKPPAPPGKVRRNK